MTVIQQQQQSSRSAALEHALLDQEPVLTCYLIDKRVISTRSGLRKEQSDCRRQGL